MEWVQNELVEKADNRIEHLEERHKNKILIKWKPKAMPMYSVEHLRKVHC
jgi:hypothetical protein